MEWEGKITHQKSNRVYGVPGVVSLKKEEKEKRI